VAVPGRSLPYRTSRMRELKQFQQRQREQHWRQLDAFAGDQLMMLEQQYMMPGPPYGWPHGRNTEHWYRWPWSRHAPPRLVSMHTDGQTDSARQTVSLEHHTLTKDWYKRP